MAKDITSTSKSRIVCFFGNYLVCWENKKNDANIWNPSFGHNNMDKFKTMTIDKFVYMLHDLSSGYDVGESGMEIFPHAMFK